MKGAILEKGQKSHTHLGQIFESLNNVQLEYYWLITDFQGYPNNKEYDRILSGEFCWLTGEQLTEMVRTEDFQWIWAVLSGFKKDVELDEILEHPLPYADGNAGFWHNPIAIQHSLADVEIVPWDSTLVLLISDVDSIVDNFLEAFPAARDLSEHNDSMV